MPTFKLHACVDASALERITALESELRRAKRAEQKLQAMLYRLRKDVETAVASATAAASTSAAGHGTKPVVVLGLEAFDKLRDVRSLEYDADMLGQKAKVSRALCWVKSGVVTNRPSTFLLACARYACYSTTFCNACVSTGG